MGRAHEVRKASMAKTGAAKAKKNGRHAKEIYMAAKAGGTSIEGNLTLKACVERAKRNQVPGDVIQKAIKKAEGGTGENYLEYRYEGYGPGGSSVIVDCLSDNVNRTVSEVKNCFTKTGGNLGVNGSVAFGYDHVSMVSVKGFEGDLFECLVEADIDVKDIEVDEDIQTVIGDVKDLHNIKQCIERTCPTAEIVEDELTLLPQNTVVIDDEEKLQKFYKFLDMLDECDDVQKVYHNVTL